jgi:hypothetical protein
MQLGLEILTALRSAARGGLAARLRTGCRTAREVAEVAALEVEGLPTGTESARPPGPTPDATMRRTSSYSLRFSASPMTS